MNIYNELYLWDHIQSLGNYDGPCTKDIIDDMLEKGMIQSPKQAWRTLEKWAECGLYEYGTSVNYGHKIPPKAVQCDPDVVHLRFIEETQFGTKNNNDTVCLPQDVLKNLKKTGKED